jgi:uncharacterized cupin superfamily protein
MRASGEEQVRTRAAPKTCSCCSARISFDAWEVSAGPGLAGCRRALWCQRTGNAFEPEWQGERGGNRVARLAAGSQRLGASIVEVASGTLSSPYHFHHANEELLIVLSGTPELRTPDGLRELQPGEIVSFPCGPEGAHRLRNASSEPCRLLFISELNFPDIVSYPDTGTTLAVTAPTARPGVPQRQRGAVD